MENISTINNSYHPFKWENIGDIKDGRSDLGEEMPVLVYRLTLYTVFDVLVRDFGKEKANYYMREAGRLAGSELARTLLDLTLPLNKFIANLQQALLDLKIGILRVEATDEDTKGIVLTVAQDLDCSGLPIDEGNVCNYDEGFLTGILEKYTGKSYTVREIDCWASGDRVCRFDCRVI